MRCIIFLILLLIASCDKEHHKVGQYVYVDCLNTIHIDRDCASTVFDKAKTKEERIMKMQGIDFIDTCKIKSHTSLSFGVKFTFCPKCIDDVAYEKLSSIMKRNESNE